ncbi:MAG: hypothetical protein ACXVQJ_11070 [Actinomycetota bacterium]
MIYQTPSGGTTASQASTVTITVATSPSTASVGP